MQQNLKINYCLDITNEVCPMTFVKTKLMLEKMKIGEVLEVRLSGGEALENVPKSVNEQGNTVISLHKPTEDIKYFRLIIKKCSSECDDIS